MQGFAEAEDDLQPVVNTDILFTGNLTNKGNYSSSQYSLFAGDNAIA
jgi:hypothetical protein